jgi:predicted nucleotidyltransferase
MNRLIQKRINKTKLVGRFLAHLPFVRCVILNGSLASGKSKPSSDIDILIIAKSGRVFTCRFFVNTIGTLLGIKRSKDDKRAHAGKFCFNYFLTENFLKIPTGRGEKVDKYCAENYSASKFVAGDYRLYEKFMKTNDELFKRYGCVSELSSRPIPNPPLGGLEEGERSRHKWCRRFLVSPMADVEMTRNIGDLLEKFLKNFQIKLINKDTRTKKYPNLIVFNDKELRFHPPKI